MQVAANDFKRLWRECEADVLSATRRVGESGWYILGPEVVAFESGFTAHCAGAHVVGCANGLDAIEISLRALSMPPGSKVLTTPLSAFATTLAILRSGGEPVYCDVDEDGLIDLERARACLERNKDIRFMVPVHLYGHLVDMAGLAELAARFDLTIVEDAAQAAGARRQGHLVGSVGQTSCFSFYPTKNLGALGDGGALATNDVALATAARSLRDYGQTEKYVHAVEGLNSRLDELHAAILASTFLPRLDGWVERRRDIARAYLDGIEHPDVILRPGPDVSGSVWHLFPVRTRQGRRDEFMRHLRGNEIGAGIHYPMLIPDQAAVTRRGPPIVADELTRARDFAEHEVSLPIHPYMTDEEVCFVIDRVNDWGR